MNITPRYEYDPSRRLIPVMQAIYKLRRATLAEIQAEAPRMPPEQVEPILDNLIGLGLVFTTLQLGPSLTYVLEPVAVPATTKSPAGPEPL